MLDQQLGSIKKCNCRLKFVTWPGFSSVRIRNQYMNDFLVITTQSDREGEKRKSHMQFIHEYQSDLEIITVPVLIDMPWHSPASS